MTIQNYTELKTAIQNHLDRDDLDEDQLIDLAEARHKREIRIREMIVRESSYSVSDRHTNLPAGFLKMLHFRLLTNPVTVLSEVTFQEMARIRLEQNGKPTHFCVIGSEIEYNKAPDDTYTGEMFYYEELDALDESTTTNALLNRAPDAYLYAALIAAEPFLRNDERIQTWSGLYATARDSLNAMDRSVAGPLVARVVGEVV